MKPTTGGTAMCGASKSSKKHIEGADAQGLTTRVETNRYHQGAFVPPGETVAECTVCLRGDRQMVTFANIPGTVQQDLGLGAVATGRFVEVNFPNDHQRSRDLVVFGTRPPVDLAELKGATAYIGIAELGSPEYVTLCEVAGVTPAFELAAVAAEGTTAEPAHVA